MADKKKVYSITINGIQESVELIKSLNEQLKELDSLIGKVENRKIVVSSEFNTDDGKTIVSSGKSKGEGAEATTKEQRIEAEKLLAVKKQITAEEKAEAQLAAMSTKEYKDSYIAQSQMKEAIKQNKQELDAMAKGAATLTDEGIQYANTMKGMKAELKALKAERDNLDLAKPEDVERFKEIQQRALELETLLKSIESEAGVFSRNVGNYPQLFKQATEEFNNINKVIDSLNEKIARATPGTEGYDKLKSELEAAEKYAQRLNERLDDIKGNLRDSGNIGFNVQVGDKVREFTSMKDAVKTLTKELNEMTLAGKNNTKEFDDTIKALGRVKTAIKSTSNEIQSYVGNTKALNDTLEIMRGVSGIVSIGVGLQGLFGGKNEDLDEAIRKFTQLTLVMQGIEELQKSMQDENAIFGKVLGGTWQFITDNLKRAEVALVSYAKKFTDFLHLTSGIQKIANAWKDWANAGSAVINNFKLDLLTEKFDKLISKSEDLKKAWDNLDKFEFTNGDNPVKDLLEILGGDVEKTKEALSGMGKAFGEDGLKEINKTLDDFDIALIKSGKTGEQVRKVMAKSAATMKALGVATLATTKDIVRMGVASQIWAAILKGVTVVAYSAVAALEALATATVILVALQAVMWVLEKAVDAVADAFSKLKGASELDLDEKMSMIEENTELANKQLERFINNLKVMKDLGLISELQMQGLAFKAIGDEITKAGEELQKFIELNDELEMVALRNNLNNSHIWGDDADIKNLEEFKKEYDILIRAVEQGLDKIEAGSERGWGWLLTSGDAVEELGDKTKAVLGDMQIKINQIDFKNPEQAVKDFRKIMDNELYNSALTQMHTLFPEDEWAKALDRMYNRLSTMVEMSEKRAQDLAVAMKNANEDLEDATRLSEINAIADQKKRQEELDKYNKEKRQKEINESVADEEHKKRALEALDKEYEQRRKDREKNAAKDSTKNAGELYNTMKQIRQNLLELEADGLDKQIKQLQNAMEDELHAAEKAGKLRGELILSIQKKYQKKIEDARTEWYKNLKKQSERWNRELQQFVEQSANELADIIANSKLGDIQRLLDSNEQINIERQANISFNTEYTAPDEFNENDENLKRQQEYYNELLEQQKDYINEKIQLQLQEEEQTYQQNRTAAEREYKERLRSNNDWLEAQKEQQEEFRKRGLVDEEQYRKNIAAIEERYYDAQAEALEGYSHKIAQLVADSEHEQTKITEEGVRERQKIQDDANKNNLEALKQHFSNVKEISEKASKANTNSFTGMFDYGAEKKRLKDLQDEYRKHFAALDEAYEELRNQYNNKQIDFTQFEQGKKEIDEFRKSLEEGAEETGAQTKMLFQDWANSLNQFVQQIASQFNAMFSIFEDIQSLRLEAEEQALDAEEKMLDKQTSIVEKAYDKQADIVQRYKDAINSTEDELKEARGERRLALLDTLAQQREGYLKETEVLKQQEIEKEKIARKEEELKKKQDELEKKRKRQQQQSSIVNATINTALGVTQALSAWPPPASYAFAAAVGALGAAQIALIKSQKFAKGGLLEGKSHAEGGIKVPVRGGVAEVEGHEFIINKQTTTQNLSLIEFVNSKKKRLTLEDFYEFYTGKAKGTKGTSAMKFADGGQMPDISNVQTYAQEHPIVVDLSIDSKVSTVDIVNAIDRLTSTRVMAGLG